MRGLFYIVKGQYDRTKSPRFFNDVSGDYNTIGGYDPEDDTTIEWYRLVDNETFRTHSCGSSLDDVVGAVYTLIKKFKTKEKFLRAVFRCQKDVSKTGIRVEEEIYQTYGDHYQHRIEEMEDLAYSELKDADPIVKARKKLKRRVEGVVDIVTPKTQEVTPVKKIGAKKSPVKKKGLVPKKRHIQVEMY